ncbi:MAG: hypothetical protein M3433_02630 [Actinomycetota bacterium]|nr:hypothetical protein [Actinomycetota bacterium]
MSEDEHRAKGVCAEPGCPKLLDGPGGPELTADSYCSRHKVLFEPGSPDNEPFDPERPPEPDPLEREIDHRLERLKGLRLDCVKYRKSGSLLAHYERVVLPAIRNFVGFLHDNGREDRLLDLAHVGYRVRLDEQGEIAEVRIRGWGVEPSEYGP